MARPQKIHEHIYLIGGPGLTDSRDCCIYLLDGGDALALIDTGAGPSSPSVLANIGRLGLDAKRLALVVATHGHIDHIGGLYYWQTRGAKIAGHEKEHWALCNGDPALTAADFYGLPYQPVSLDITLTGNLTPLPVGNLTLNCLFTPGHTPGGISPYVDIAGTRILFGQDIHGPFHPAWGSDRHQWRDSMQTLLDLQADILCEGHFGIYRPREKVQAYINSCLRQYK